MKKFFKKLWKFAINNYFISIFLACIVFVGLVSFYKLFFVQPTFVYAKVKVGQGLWWATTQHPSFWFVESLKKGMEETDLTGEPIAEIQDLLYYSYYGGSQYDIYLNLKLKATGSQKTKKYNFKRSAIGVGAPIDLEFPTVQVSGTIIELSEKPINDGLVEKTVYLTKKYAYPWEYDAIQIGDKFYNGREVVFEVLDKSQSDSYETAINTGSGEFPNTTDPSQTELRKYIIVKAKIKIRPFGDKLIFGEEHIISPGRTSPVSTDAYAFNNFLIEKVE